MITAKSRLGKEYDLGERARGYQLTFCTPAGKEIVLPDLAEFCRAAETCWGSTPEETARMIGRHEVWLRIQQHINLTEKELFALYSGRSILTPEDFDRYGVV